MGIKSYSVICCIFFYISAFSQFEEQRKYAVENFDSLKFFIKNDEGTKTLSTHFHTESVYYDIYLDTPDFRLLQNGYSLRFRKRTSIENKTKTSYTFQLKSEMNTSQGVRMEVEEPELSFYQIPSDSIWIPLTNVLDSIFYMLTKQVQRNHPTMVTSMNLLNDWISFKSESPISPFQKLHHLGVLNTREIKNLKPVVCGISRRYRSHIFTDLTQNSALGLQKNRIKLNNLPEYFNKNSQYNWVLESSLDDSNFYDLSPKINMILNIKEFEVENKYFTSRIGTELLSVFEKDLANMFNLKPKNNSKYKQAATKLLYSQND